MKKSVSVLYSVTYNNTWKLSILIFRFRKINSEESYINHSLTDKFALVYNLWFTPINYVSSINHC